MCVSVCVCVRSFARSSFGGCCRRGRVVRTRGVWCIRLRRRRSAHRMKEGVCAGRGLGGRQERAPGDDGEMRSFPPPPPFHVERYCPTVDLDYTHTRTYDRIPDGLPRRRHTHTHACARALTAEVGIWSLREKK